MGQIVVAVVDDLIVEVHAVILVGGVGGERCQLAQVCRCFVGECDKVAAQLVLKVILISQLLHGLHDAVGVEDGVGLLVECRLKELARAVGLEHVLTRSEKCKVKSEKCCASHPRHCVLYLVNHNS